MFERFNNKPVAEFTDSDKIHCAEELWYARARAHCASHLISDMLQACHSEGSHPDWEDELTELSGGDRECTECDGTGHIHDDEYKGDPDDYDEMENDVECTECDGTGSVTLEIYEHWIVDDWYARQLEGKGELIVEIYGLKIWGRQCTGQSVALDHSPQSIALELYERWRDKTCQHCQGTGETPRLVDDNGPTWINVACQCCQGTGKH